MAENSGGLPLQFQLLDKVGEGNQHEVFAYSNDWVIKQSKQLGEKASFDKLRKESEDLKLFQKFIPDFIPVTHFFRGRGEDGEVHNFVAQKHIKGRPLSSLTDEERRNPELKSQLARFFQGCLEMWEKEGRVPDLRKVGEEKVGYRFFAPGNTDNILIEDGNNHVWLVDQSADRFIFSKEGIMGDFEPDLVKNRLMSAIKTFSKK